MDALAILNEWNRLPNKRFQRQSEHSSSELACDCSGLITLLFEQVSQPLPYGLQRPKAVHFYNILQEIGSSHISSLKPGNLLAWRKEQLPKSGDTGHVLVLASDPVEVSPQIYEVEIYDSTKASDGLSCRVLALHTNEQGRIIGVQLHQCDKKVKRTPIYHAAIGTGRNCFGCGLPKRMCLCGKVEADFNAPPIIIFRHPDERGRTLSTVSLIKQRYPNVLVKEGEIFSEPRLGNLTLLFPGGDKFGPECDQTSDENRNYLLIDATWRKAKKMLHLNPWMQTLPRISLDTGTLSNYIIRKVPDAGALSTVEAFAFLAGDESLQGLFAEMMGKQVALMGEKTYKANYTDHLNFRSKSN